jgi:hypothetical protein
VPTATQVESVLPSATPGKYSSLFCVVSTDTSNLNTTENNVVPSGAPASSPLQEGMETLIWPEETDIQFVPGTNRVILTRQGTLLRTVIQDAFEHVRTSILFEHAFPDVALSLSFIRDGLVNAAGSGPATASIYNRLLNDKDYLPRIVPLVSNPYIKENATDI